MYTQDEFDEMDRLCDLLRAQYESCVKAQKRNMDVLVRLGTEIASNSGHGRPDLVKQYLDLVNETVVLDGSLARAKTSLADLYTQRSIARLVLSDSATR